MVPLYMRSSVGKRPRGLGRALDHDVAADLVLVVAEPVREAAGGRVEQQAGGLDGVAGDGHDLGPLQPLDVLAFPDVGDPSGPPAGLVDLDAGRHAVGSDLDAVGQGVGQVGDVRAGLGVDLAALQAVPAVDAVRAVPEGAVDDADRPDPHRDPRAMAPRHSTEAASETGCGENG